MIRSRTLHRIALRKAFFILACVISMRGLTADEPSQVFEPLTDQAAADPIAMDDFWRSVQPVTIKDDGIESVAGPTSAAPGFAAMGSPAASHAAGFVSPAATSGRRVAPESKLTILGGFDAVFGQMRFGDDVALNLETEDLGGNATRRAIGFDRDLQFAPQVWFELRRTEAFGLRAIYTDYENRADTVTLNPPANGFGLVDPPFQFDVDLSSTVPDETVIADSTSDLRDIRVEATHRMLLSGWDCSLAAGVRYLHLDTDYHLSLLNTAGDLSGTLRRQQETEGVGPSIFVGSRRRIGRRLWIGGDLRGSVLMSQLDSRITAAEDLDLVTSFTTEVNETFDQVLPALDTRLVGGYVLPSFGRVPGGWIAGGGLQSTWIGGVRGPSGAASDLGVLSVFAGLTYTR